MGKTIPANPAAKPDMGLSKRPPIGKGAGMGKSASAGAKSGGKRSA